MKTLLDQQTLIIYLEGRIDQQNAESVKAQMEAAISQTPAERLQLDATDLSYISSMGLRILLNLAKQRKEKISIVNVKPEVMDIFQMTGFTELFLIRKPLRQISIEG
ncbi:MAG: STAS domain-containing protein, partial [bacterium]